MHTIIILFVLLLITGLSLDKAYQQEELRKAFAQHHFRKALKNLNEWIDKNPYENASHPEYQTLLQICAGKLAILEITYGDSMPTHLARYSDAQTTKMLAQIEN